MINKFSILNETKDFSSGIFQNYLVFILVGLLGLIRGNLMECQKIILKM